jgi:hypothetical protein
VTADGKTLPPVQVGDPDHEDLDAIRHPSILPHAQGTFPRTRAADYPPARCARLALVRGSQVNLSVVDMVGPS